MTCMNFLFVLWALFTTMRVSIGNGMMSHGAVETTNSDLFTYTNDLVEDSDSSGRSRNTSMDNQPF